MPLSKDITTYEDVRQYLDAALSDPAGVRIRTPTSGKATYLSQRLNQLRVLERRASLDQYEVGDSRRGTSAWDSLTIRTDGASVVILAGAPITVEFLSHDIQ